MNSKFFLFFVVTFYIVSTTRTYAYLTSLQIDPETQFVTVNSHNSSRTPSVYWDQVAQRVILKDDSGPTISSGCFAILHTALYNVWALYNPPASPSIPIPDTERPRSKRFLLISLEHAAVTVLSNLFPRQERYIRSHLQYSTTKGKKIGTRIAMRVIRYYQREKRTDIVQDYYKYFEHTTVLDRWEPERVPIDDPNGALQKFTTPSFGIQKPFSILHGKSYRPSPPQLFLNTPGTVDLTRKRIVLLNGSEYMISKDLIGHVINKYFIKQAKEVILFSRGLPKQKEKGKMSAEFWEDGPGTSYPPGKWQAFTQFVSTRDYHSLDEDIKMFFIVSNSQRDAGIATWNTKYYYYYARPVSVIRKLGQLGLIGRYSEKLGGFSIKAYSIKHKKVIRMLAESFNTYQDPTRDASPPFAEYTSGHSAFSSAAAKALQLVKGTGFFGATVEIRRGDSRFEKGYSPKQNVHLSWLTFADAANDAGISRLWGGIHFMQGNLEGAKLGEKIGKLTYQRAMRLFKGSERY